MRDIPNFAVLIGANGTGKTTFVDVFGFLRDSLTHNVRTAVQKRAGFAQLVSRGHEGETIEIQLKVELDFSGRGSRIVTYTIEVGEEQRRVVVKRERLSWRRGSSGKPFNFIDFRNGEGEAVPESFDVPESALTREHQVLDAPDILALKGLGQFKRFDAASQLRELIEGWTVSDFHINDARIEPDAAPAEHLSETGDNLALYAQFLNETHPEIFKELLKKMAARIPGIAEVSPEDTGDGRVLLRFRDAAFDKGFIARAVSDGTIKMFAYLALLHDPQPQPLLCIEEPENQLYPTLLPILAEEFAGYATGRKNNAQVFVTTHSPDFLNSVPLDSIYWIRKERGFSIIEHAGANPQIAALIAEGDKPGWLWRQGLFSGADPK
jgi:predicted ATPase